MRPLSCCIKQTNSELWVPEGSDSMDHHGSIYPGHAGAAGPRTTLIIKDLPYHPDSIIHSLDIACARTLKINIKVINGNSTQIGMVERKKLLEQTNGKPKDDSRFSSMQKPKLCK